MAENITSLKFSTDGEPPAAFLLELCGVLYDDSCWRRWMLQLLTRMGVHTQYTAFYQTWEQDHFRRVCTGELLYWEAMYEFLRCVGLTSGRANEACAAGQSRRKQWEQSIRPLPGVLETLRMLSSANVPLAVIAHASFDRATARAKLNELGLSRYISGGVRTTSDLGREGRYEDRFLEAAAELGLPPHRTAYVGCGRRPLEQAAKNQLICFAHNTELTTLDCEVLPNFRALQDFVRVTPTRRAG